MHPINKSCPRFSSMKYQIHEIEDNDICILEVLDNLAPLGELDTSTTLDILQQIR
jgi:hypothetical protein